MAYAIERTHWHVAAAVTPSPTTYGIGNAFLGDYVLPFEVASLVLLAALIGAIVISRHEARSRGRVMLGTIGLNHFLLLSLMIFSLGMVCVLTRRNAIGILMGVELILNSANINYLAFAFTAAATTTAKSSPSS